MIGTWGTEGRTWGYPTGSNRRDFSWNILELWSAGMEGSKILAGVFFLESLSDMRWTCWGSLSWHSKTLSDGTCFFHGFFSVMSRHMDGKSLREKALSHRTSGTLWKLLWWIAHGASRCTAWAGSLQPISTQHWGLTSHVIAQRDGAWNLNPNQNSLATYLYYILHCLMNIYSLGEDDNADLSSTSPLCLSC